MRFYVERDMYIDDILVNIYKKYLMWYYRAKPFIPRFCQLLIRKAMVKRVKHKYKSVWPINENCGKSPLGFKGWPEKKKFAFVLTHDVESSLGYQKVKKLVMLEKQLGFRSSLNFVPKRYSVANELRSFITGNGFEIGVHGLFHDGKLYSSQGVFKKRAIQINRYLKEWGAVGFRAPSMHHHLDWNCFLNIEYDLSTFDTDPFEPHSDGLGTIFPIEIEECKYKKENCPDCAGYIEIPYTLPQDFTLFILLKRRESTSGNKRLIG